MTWTGGVRAIASAYREGARKEPYLAASGCGQPQAEPPWRVQGLRIGRGSEMETLSEWMR